MLLAKLYPSQYGDVHQTRHAGQDGGPLQLPTTLDLSRLDDRQLDQLFSLVSAVAGAVPTNDNAAEDESEAAEG